jgi:hypothetical protein
VCAVKRITLRRRSGQSPPGEVAAPARATPAALGASALAAGEPRQGVPANVLQQRAHVRRAFRARGNVPSLSAGV